MIPIISPFFASKETRLKTCFFSYPNPISFICNMCKRNSRWKTSYSMTRSPSKAVCQFIMQPFKVFVTSGGNYRGNYFRCFIRMDGLDGFCQFSEEILSAFNQALPFLCLLHFVLPPVSADDRSENLNAGRQFFIDKHPGNFYGVCLFFCCCHYLNIRFPIHRLHPFFKQVV